MALVKCSECHHLISDKAKACPNCGAEFIDDLPFTEAVIQLITLACQLALGVIILALIVGAFID